MWTPAGPRVRRVADHRVRRSAVIQVGVTLRNPRKAEHPGGHWELGDAGSLLLEDVTFALPLPARDRATAAACSPDEGVALARCRRCPSPSTRNRAAASAGRGPITSIETGESPRRLRGYRRSDGITGLRATPLLASADICRRDHPGHEAVLAELPEAAGHRRGRSELLVVAARVSGRP